MFGNKSKRRRAASNPPLNGSNANPSATTAAAQAFLKNRSSNASLSSAAAAAALRSRPTTPTSVADVQTKRTIRRAGSVSSVASSAAGSSKGGRPQLERRGSSGSMSERTFRDSSPARSQNGHSPIDVDAPPVPAIPKSMQQYTPAITTKSHRRATSMDAPPLRVTSPGPNKANGRGSSLGPATTAYQPRRAGQQRPGSLSSVQELTGVGSPARGANPARIVSPNNQNLVYDPNTRSFLPEADIFAIEQRVWDTANTPVRKAKRIASKQATGTHLAQGTVGGRPRGTAVDAMEAASQPTSPPVELPASLPQQMQAALSKEVSAPGRSAPEAPAAEAPTIRKKKKVVISDSESDQASCIPDSSDNDSDFSTQGQQFNTRAGALLAKKPSIVREDKEGEEKEDDTPSRLIVRTNTTPEVVRNASPSPLPRSQAGRGHGRRQASAKNHPQPTQAASESSPPTVGVGAATKDSVHRVPSVSPARATHFATTPDSLLVMHQPPARSISPRKSAMKHSHSPRDLSPTATRSRDQSISEGSNGTVITNGDDLPVPRKKANRVSFDETNVIVGPAATPVTTDSPVQSPQIKRPWFSLGRGKKKETAAVVDDVDDDDDDDEVMKPRPALPSFGSVREKKPNRESEERALVKPTELVDYKKPTASPPLSTFPIDETKEYPLGQSNDQVVSSAVAQDAVSKNAANISKSREPLPPQVTSVEGSGYSSDADSSTCSVDNKTLDTSISRADSVKRGPEDGHAGIYRALASPDGDVHAKKEDEDMPTRKANDTVPAIAIQHATPTLESTNSKREWPDMPGAWGSSTSDTDKPSPRQDESAPSVVEHHVTEPTPADIGIAEPDPIAHSHGTPAVGEVAAQNVHTSPAIMEESEDDSSIYSDAAEDLSDAEGDGFMSLDAVVESPIRKTNTSLPGLADATPPPDSPTTKVTKEKAYRKSQLTRVDSAPDAGEGWDKVQSYWSTLSADKKRQLELEAREDADDSDDTEVETPKPKPKKSILKKSSSPLPALAPSPVYERSYMIQPGAKAGPNGHASMRSSMRAEPAVAPGDTHIRKSMRGNESRSLRGASGAPEPRGSLQKKVRPMSLPAGEIKADPVEVQRHARNLSAASAAAASSPAAARRDMAPKPKPQPVLRRKGSADSDSSFRRSKPKKEGLGFSSMRGPSESEAGSIRQPSPQRSSRFSLRSLSPTGSVLRRPFNSGGPPSANSASIHMRSSMRSSSVSTPSMRNHSSNGVDLGRSGPAKPAKQKVSKPRSSRFGDSSDEEDERPAFRSRFVDSSDEDEPGPAPRVTGMAKSLRTNAPVRAIPRRSGVADGDSSDLPDSDDDKPIIDIKRGTNGTNGTSAAAVTATNQGVNLASGSLRRSGSGRGTISSPIATNGPTSERPKNARRGSFMSILRRKKADPTSKVRKSDAESPARRDTHLERTKFNLANLRAENENSRPMSPKLQKRNPMSRENSSTTAAWPLPLPSKLIIEGERPNTADNNGTVGVAVSGNRPDLGTRRFTATGISDIDLNGIGATPKKKKKFPALRRMFKLDG